MTPRFSIVIPTRNRAGLLRHALATAIAQTHTDVEIVVSDNASADDTEAVAKEAGDPRVRYVRADAALAQHDSWEFAVSHAAGEWVTVLGDDDGLVPTALERVDEALGSAAAGLSGALAWSEAWYVHGEFPPPGVGPDEANLLTVEPWTGETRQVDGADLIERFFARREGRPVPGLVNSVVSRALLAQIRSRVGRLFPAPDPAVAIITAVCAVGGGYAALDVPLGLKGLSGATISVGLSRDMRDMHQSVEEFDTAGLFAHVPLRSRTGTNLVAESLLRMKQAIPAELAVHDLDLVRYFVEVRRELADGRRRGDRGAALSEWDRVLADQPSYVQGGVRRELRRLDAGDRVRRWARRLPGARRLHEALRREAGPEFLVVPGAAHGFADLSGAARYLDESVLPARAVA